MLKEVAAHRDVGFGNHEDVKLREQVSGSGEDGGLWARRLVDAAETPSCPS